MNGLTALTGTAAAPFVDVGLALIAGLFGAMMMSAFWFVLRVSGWMKLDWAQVVGSFVVRPGHRALAIGLTWRFVMGTAVGLVYAYLLVNVWGLWPTAGTAMGLGVLHGLLALVMLFLLPRFHPRIQARWATHVWPSRDLSWFALGYAIYGLAFGGAYHSVPYWVTAFGMTAEQFWLSALGVLAIAFIIGVATQVLLPGAGAAEGPLFASGMPSAAERRDRLHRLYAQGRISKEEYASEMAEIEQSGT